MNGMIAFQAKTGPRKPFTNKTKFLLFVFLFLSLRNPL